MNIVLEMKSLLFLLFLGAVVATLAEEPFEDEAVAELLDEEDDETITELADEENDPRRRPRPSGRPPRPSGIPKAVRSSPLSPFSCRLLGFAESALSSKLNLFNIPFNALIRLVLSVESSGILRENRARSTRKLRTLCG